MIDTQKRLRFVAILFTFYALASVWLTEASTTAAGFGLNPRYPGVLPGSASIQCVRSNLIASNAAFAVSWTLTSHGLEAPSVRDVQTGRTLGFTGELFQLVLTNGQRYPASTLVPETKPRVNELVPVATASRLARRVPGWQIEVPLRSPDGRLRVLWRAVLRDGANYVRQETPGCRGQ